VKSLLPVWVEQKQPGDPTPRMYYAELASDLTATVHEIPYPFPDGTRPNLLVPWDWTTLLVVDQSSAPPYDLLAAVLIVNSPTDRTWVTLRVPAPGRVRGAAIESLLPEDYEPPNTWTHRVVQFFEDTHAFVALDDVGKQDPTDLTPHQLFESARGSWPFHVVDGDHWVEGCDNHGGFNDIPAALRHPYPLVVLTDTGDIYTWQFSDGPGPESFLAPFAHVAPGSSALRTSGDTYNNHLHVLEPDGTMVRLEDADCQDLRSGAMQPLRITATDPWTTAIHVDGNWPNLEFGFGSIVDQYFVLQP
jgi:hypothetical protein